MRFFLTTTSHTCRAIKPTRRVAFKLLINCNGITVDSDLKFDKHTSDSYDKSSKKINALCRVTGYTCP